MIDCYKDPYQEYTTCRTKRKEFNKLKNTNSFKLWLTRQKKVQKNRCAYCRTNLSASGIITHIDHVTPLRFDGKNDFSNFVLSCKACNLKKWIANNYVVPEWIQVNDEKLRQKQRLRQLRKKQLKQAIELNDNIIMDELSWIT